MLTLARTLHRVTFPEPPLQIKQRSIRCLDLKNMSAFSGAAGFIFSRPSAQTSFALQIKASKWPHRCRPAFTSGLMAHDGATCRNLCRLQLIEGHLFQFKADWRDRAGSCCCCCWGVDWSLLGHPKSV